MSQNLKNFSLEELVQKLDTTDAKKAWGEIIVRLINSNNSLTSKMEILIVTLIKSSNESTRINKAIMYLTITIACAALFTIIKIVFDLIQNGANPKYIIF